MTKIKHAYQVIWWQKKLDRLEKREKKSSSKARKAYITTIKSLIAAFKYGASTDYRASDYVQRQKEKQKFATQLRSNMTASERLLWKEVKPLGFVAQSVVLGYIPDFYHPGRRVIIEVDGKIHETEKQVAYDQERDEVFRSRGIFTFRVTNNQVANDLQKIMAQIKKLVTV